LQEVSEQDDKLRAANEVGARLAAQCAHIQACPKFRMSDKQS
jgi:hypothetical protein